MVGDEQKSLHTHRSKAKRVLWKQNRSPNIWSQGKSGKKKLVNTPSRTLLPNALGIVKIKQRQQCSLDKNKMFHNFNAWKGFALTFSPPPHTHTLFLFLFSRRWYFRKRRYDKGIPFPTFESTFCLIDITENPLYTLLRFRTIIWHCVQSPSAVKRNFLGRNYATAVPQLVRSFTIQ